MSKTLSPTKQSIGQRLLARLESVPLIKPLFESVLPRPRLLKDETIELKIHMANYRAKVAEYGASICAVLLLISAPVAVLSWLLSWTSIMRFASVVAALLSLVGVLESLRHVLIHHQWQFIVTNRRYIIITPDPKRWVLADAIYLKRGKIQVVDTNWSRSPVWGFFQATTGARDVVLSLAGYAFKPEGAEVTGGLLFPDVMPKDIAQLEELVFG